MISQFIIADFLIKMKVSKNKVVKIISTLNIVLYLLLLIFFYTNFHSLIILAAELLLLTSFYFLRLFYLKKYLKIDKFG